MTGNDDAVDTNRMEAFTDGVLAIVITIMVLELRPPENPTLESVRPLIPIFLSYLLSFVFLSIFWNNHHHLFKAADELDGRVLWANQHLLFWLALIPSATAWMGKSGFGPWPVATYGLILTMCCVGYRVLLVTLLRLHPPESLLAKTFVGERKSIGSIFAYALAVPLAFVSPFISSAVFAGMAILWFLPHRRVEQKLDEEPAHPSPEDR